MSSSNRVRLTFLEEIDYGVTPIGDYTAISFINEDLSGTPLVVESAEIRSDRQSSGQVNTGLELTGGYNFELSNDISHQFFIGQAMMGALQPEGAHVTDLIIDAVANTITTVAGDFTAAVSAGHMLKLFGFVNQENNTVVMVDSVDPTGASITYTGEGLVDEAATLAGGNRPQYYEIGSEDKSCTICKEFLDVADANARSITYAGERTAEMSMSFAFGEIVTGSFVLAGNGYDLPTTPINTGETIIPVGSDPKLDASNGFGWLLIDGQELDICLETLSFTLNNNITAQNCIGELAPKDQTVGSVSISFESTMNLSLVSWDKFMPAKISQTPMSLAFFTQDFNGNGYGVVIHRVQFNFPDPAATGKDETVTLDATGVASYDAGESNTMRIYILENEIVTP